MKADNLPAWLPKLSHPWLCICLIWLLASHSFQALAHDAANHLPAALDLQRLPNHVAIIMDGNGRWAMQRGKHRTFGHQQAAKSVREVIEACVELHIPYVTLYAFSTENWKRPATEVDFLLRLMFTTLATELNELIEQGVRLSFVGDLRRLPQSYQEAIQRATEASKNNHRLHLTIALSYGGRWELAEAVRSIAKDVKKGLLDANEIDEQFVAQRLATGGIPDLDLLIRTGGEMRLSNFLPWQLAYAELFFTPVWWPDFRKKHFYEAILAYQNRARTFGCLRQEEVAAKH